MNKQQYQCSSFGKTYIFIIWKEPICGRLRSMAVQQMSVLLLQIFCFLLSGSQEYGLIYAFWFLLFNIHPPLISYPKKTTLHIIKSKYFFFCSLLDQLMIIRKEFTLVLNKKENYVNKNFSSAMP